MTAIGNRLTQCASRRVVVSLLVVVSCATAVPILYHATSNPAGAADRADQVVVYVDADKPASPPEFLPTLPVSEQRILNALEQHTELELQETSLTDVIGFIKEHHSIEVQIDPKALSDLSLDAATTNLTNSIRGISLKAALRIILKPLDLTFMVRDEVLMVTSCAELEEYVVTRTYPVEDLLAGPDADSAYRSLVDAITGTLEPDTWSDNQKAARGAIKVFQASESLVISQNPPMHDKVLTLLRSLRKARALSPRHAAGAAATPKTAPARLTPKAPPVEAPATPPGEDPFK